MEASSIVSPSLAVAFDRAYPSTAKDSLATTSSFIEEVTVASSVASPSQVATFASDHSQVIVEPYLAFVPTCFELVTSGAAWVVIASQAVTSLEPIVATFQPPYRASPTTFTELDFAVVAPFVAGSLGPISFAQPSIVVITPVISIDLRFASFRWLQYLPNT